MKAFLKIIVSGVLLVGCFLILTSCASFDASEKVFVPQSNSELPKRQERVAFGYILSNPEKKPIGQEAFADAMNTVIQRNFAASLPLGELSNKDLVSSIIQQKQLSEKIDHILLLTAIKQNRYAKFISRDFLDVGDEFDFDYSLTTIKDEPVEKKHIFGKGSESGNLPVDFKRPERLTRTAIIDSAQQLERAIQENRLAADEERRKRELIEKLNLVQEKFKPYGFDILGFVGFARDNLKVRGEINFGDAVPEIDFRKFKDNNYVEVKINYLVTYNSLKVSMYDAASMTFDEIVKKLAKKISTDFKAQENIAGFIFNVTYTTKDFLEKSDMAKLVRNEFVLPKAACGQYAALDITNQDLINQSIVLVDGERISLNLQISK